MRSAVSLFVFGCTFLDSRESNGFDCQFGCHWGCPSDHEFKSRPGRQRLARAPQTESAGTDVLLDLWPEDIVNRRGLDECTCCGGKFRICGGQRICLQLGQRDVFSVVCVRPVQLGRYSPCVILHRSVAEAPNSQPADLIENLPADPFTELAAAHRFVDQRQGLRTHQCGSGQAMLRRNRRCTRVQFDSRRRVDDKRGHPTQSQRRPGA